MVYPVRSRQRNSVVTTNGEKSAEVIVVERRRTEQFERRNELKL